MSEENLKLFKSVFKLSAETLNEAESKINQAQIESLIERFKVIKSSGSSLVFTGVGKSGIIAKKCASTFASLGLNSFFLHPVEALHGDLGRVSSGDQFVILSNSGTTEEILKLLPYLEVSKEQVIGLLGNIHSPLAREAGIVFDCSVKKEACLNNQAPTTSTTMAMVMGDAMAVLYEKFVNLSKEGFAINHPGGLLGKSLRLKVKDLMVHETECAKVNASDTLQEVILQMTKYPLGACAVITNTNVFKGLIVEGDIRRTLVENNGELKTKVLDILNSGPIVSSPDEMAMDALKKMEGGKTKCYVLPVLEGDKLMGMIRMHDLLKEGFKAPS